MKCFMSSFNLAKNRFTTFPASTCERGKLFLFSIYQTLDHIISQKYSNKSLQIYKNEGPLPPSGQQIVTNFISTNKQHIKIKLMQNETNRWSIFGKEEILVKL